MILLDTNVPIYAYDPDSLFCQWARDTIADAVIGDGAAINAVSLAEICVGDADPPTAADRIRSWGVQIVDLPAAAADVCATVYRRYRKQRVSQSNAPVPVMPLPDFFIGAHAWIMGWEIATVDRGRFLTYFPSVSLKMPQLPAPGQPNMNSKKHGLPLLPIRIDAGIVKIKLINQLRDESP